MTKEDIKTIIELFISWNGENEPIDISNLDYAIEYINDCIKSSSPSNLDKAAEKCKESLHITETHKEIDLSFIDKSIAEVRVRDLVKAAMRTAFDEGKRTGVEWMAGQGVSVDGEVVVSHGNKTIEHRSRYGIQETTTPGIDVFNVGDKVVVQIRKK